MFLLIFLLYEILIIELQFKQLLLNIKRCILQSKIKSFTFTLNILGSIVWNGVDCGVDYHVTLILTLLVVHLNLKILVALPSTTFFLVELLFNSVVWFLSGLAVFVHTVFFWVNHLLLFLNIFGIQFVVVWVLRHWVDCGDVSFLLKNLISQWVNVFFLAFWHFLSF